MSRFVPTAFSTKECEASQEALVQWINGSSAAPAPLLERISLESLQAAALAAKEAAASEENPSARMVGMYAMALYRDAAYAHASRGVLMGGGARSKFVDLGQGALTTETYPIA